MDDGKEKSIKYRKKGHSRLLVNSTHKPEPLTSTCTCLALLFIGRIQRRPNIACILRNGLKETLLFRTHVVLSLSLFCAQKHDWITLTSVQSPKKASAALRDFDCEVDSLLVDPFLAVTGMIIASVVKPLALSFLMTFQWPL